MDWNLNFVTDTVPDFVGVKMCCFSVSESNMRVEDGTILQYTDLVIFVTFYSWFYF